MVIQDGLGDIQPQAAAAAVPVPGFVNPVKWREDTLQIFFGNVDAGILHGKHLVSDAVFRLGNFPRQVPACGNTLMVHCEGGVEVELRCFLGGVGDGVKKAAALMYSKPPLWVFMAW